MDDVEGPPYALVAVEGRNEGAAHVPDVLHHAAVLVVGHLVIVDAKDLVLHGAALSAGEDVDLMPCAVQSPRELGDVRGDAADGNGVQRLPREHRDLQGALADDGVLRRLDARQDGLPGAGEPRARHALQELARRPILVAALQELPEDPRRPAALPEVEAQAAALDGRAEAREEGGVVGDHGRDLAQPLGLLVHDGSRQPQVANGGCVDAAGLLEVLDQLLRPLGQPAAALGVDHGGDAREAEAVQTEPGHPEGQAGQQVPLDLPVLVPEDARPRDRVRRLHSVPEVLVGEAVAAPGGAVVRNAHVNAQARRVRLGHKGLQVLGLPQEGGRREVAARLGAHLRVLLALLDADEQQCGVAVAHYSWDQHLRCLLEGLWLALPRREAKVALVDALTGLPRRDRRRGRRRLQRPDDGVHDVELAGEDHAGSPRRRDVEIAAVDTLRIDLVLLALDQSLRLRRLDLAHPDVCLLRVLVHGCRSLIPVVEVADEEGGVHLRQPLPEGPSVAVLLQAEVLEALRSTHVALLQLQGLHAEGRLALCRHSLRRGFLRQIVRTEEVHRGPASHLLHAVN
mmetsp:Transcript_70712/g.210865  ORF Transcript_70712/g.210865 Transcript_70712/m.210865 type:complete len:570 (+) Transcript_70712:1772-3481(+)